MEQFLFPGTWNSLIFNKMLCLNKMFYSEFNVSEWNMKTQYYM